MSPVTSRRNPLRNVASAGPWRAMVYLFSYGPIGAVLFGGVLGVVVVSFADRVEQPVDPRADLCFVVGHACETELILLM